VVATLKSRDAILEGSGNCRPGKDDQKNEPGQYAPRHHDTPLSIDRAYSPSTIRRHPNGTMTLNDLQPAM
jgi:hypothetical protein